MNNEELISLIKNRNGLKVKLKSSQNISLNLTYLALKNSGIEKPEEFIHPHNYTKTQINDIHNISNMDKIEKSINHNEHIGVLVDVDTDGMMSAAMLINYIKKAYKNYDNITPILPDAKLHGIKQNMGLIKYLNDKEPFDMIIAPDSSSNDINSINHLLDEYGIETIVIDHHQMNLATESEATENIINNQSSFNGNAVNTNFTGAGMVYECLKYLDNKNDVNYAPNYLDLFAIGQIGDMSDISNLEIRALMLKGFSEVNNNLIRRYGKINRLRMSPKDLQFSIIPMINSINRVGSLSDRIALFNALIEDENQTYSIKKRRNINHHFVYENIDVDIYDYAIKRMERNKYTQNKMVKKSLKEAKWLSEDSDNFNMLIIPELDSGISGLIANKVMSETSKPTFVLKKDKLKKTDSSLTKEARKLTGSLRIPMQYVENLQPLRDRLGVLHSLIFAEGHENAAGISFYFKNDRHMKASFEILNHMYKPVETTYEIDKYLVNDTPSLISFYDVDESLHCFGGKIKEPEMAILGLEVSVNDFKINKKTLHINIKGIDFIKFNLSEDELNYVENELKGGDFHKLYVDMVGTLGINRFLGNEKPQFIMKDLKFSSKIKEHEENLIF